MMIYGISIWCRYLGKSWTKFCRNNFIEGRLGSIEKMDLIYHLTVLAMHQQFGQFVREQLHALTDIYDCYEFSCISYLYEVLQSE